MNEFRLPTSWYGEGDPEADTRAPWERWLAGECDYDTLPAEDKKVADDFLTLAEPA